MASETKNPVGEFLTWAATISGVVALIGVFIPITQEVLTATGLWGWVAFAVLLTLLPWIVRFWANFLVRARQGDLRKVWEDQQLARDRNSKDLVLLREWLDGWNLHGDFHVYLVEHIHFGNLPSWFVQQIHERRYMWDRDPRELENPALRAEWEEFKHALIDFADKINEHMWLEPRSKTEREAGVEAPFHIPPEWKTHDHRRYQTAVDELTKSARAMAVSMNSLFGAMYSFPRGT